MTHKEVKFGKGKRSRKAKPGEEEFESGSASQRAVLLSSDDVDRMAEENSRARFINRLVSKSEDQQATREFTSYYRGSTRYIEPPYSITSHTNRVYIPQALQVIPTYQSLFKTPQLNPYIRQTSGQNSQTDLTMKRKYNCRCVECLSADCPARTNSTFRPRTIKDNIMTFCDRCTMTRNLNDASCGCTPTSSTFNCPAVSVSCETSVTGGRDQGKPKIYEMNNTLGTYIPVPILKKGYIEDTVNNSFCIKKFQDGHNKIEPPKSMSIDSFITKKEYDRTGCKSSRKNIYNEGISDVALKFPSSPKRGSRHSATPVRARSRAALSSQCWDSDDNIPHSHRRESRYHKYCAEMPKQFVLDGGMVGRDSKHRVLVSNPRISPGKTSSCKRSKEQQRIIKLPKKVLTSEKLADASTRKPKGPSTRK